MLSNQSFHKKQKRYIRKTVSKDFIFAETVEKFLHFYGGAKVRMRCAVF